jgi:acyl-homoserine lactone acylase PvdQ
MSGLRSRYLCVLAILLIPFGTPILGAERSCTASVDLLRDSYAIPHVFSDSVRGAYYAAGWAEAEDQAATFADLVLRGEGRRAEFFGSGNIGSDIRARAFELVRSAERRIGTIKRCFGYRPEYRSGRSVR